MDKDIEIINKYLLDEREPYIDIDYTECEEARKAIKNLINRNKSLEQENKFLKTMYTNTDKFKNFEKYIDNLRS